MPAVMGIDHVSLTVTDVDRSVPWYERVLGLNTAFRREDDPQPDGGLRSVRLTGHGIEVTLVQHPVGGERVSFDETRPGLDHLALRIDSAAEAEWTAWLDEHGVSYSKEHNAITFTDPDGIQLELWLSPRS